MIQVWTKASPCPSGLEWRNIAGIAALTAIFCAVLFWADPVDGERRPVFTTNDSGTVLPNRPVTVADSILMTQIGVRGSEVLDSATATFSPDGKQFIILTHRGNLEENSNDYSLLLFHSADAFHSPRPEVLLRWPSSTNQPAITGIRWLTDNRTILFLGEKPAHKQQIYALNVHTRELRQLTRHSTDILAFDVTPDLRTIMYLARRPITGMVDKSSQTHGLLISEQLLADLLIGHNSDFWSKSPLELFVVRRGSGARQIVFSHPETAVPMFGVSLAPGGAFAIVVSNTRRYPSPESWKSYVTVYGVNPNDFLVHLLIDAQGRLVRPLIAAPTNFERSFAWSADGTSVVVGGTFLPLSIDDALERELRKTTPWAAEVDLRSGSIRKITPGTYHVLNWEQSTDTVFLKPAATQSITSGADRADQRLVAFRKRGDHWEKVKPNSIARDRALEIQEEQDMNTPPRLFAVQQTTGAKALLLDPNPQFRTLRFGHVEEITWRGSDGAEYRGGLYVPPDFVPGRRYPFVMQAYGWNPGEFWIDGPFTSGFAAQALAGKGIVVAQLPLARELGTTREGPQSAAMREGLIDDLDRRGIIDRDRVGLMGFSRAGYAVRYTLAFSKYPIVAAAILAGSEGGYLEYLAGFHERAGGDYEKQNGAPPYGEGLQMWLRNAPGFNLDKIHTPVRQLSFGQDILLNWESFVGLTRLGKPVEFIWLPDAAHEVVKPLERMTAQQGNVDWFCFWLKGEADADPAKADQYARWRKLRKMQRQNETKSRETSSAPIH